MCLSAFPSMSASLRSEDDFGKTCLVHATTLLSLKVDQDLGVGELVPLLAVLAVIVIVF